MRYSFLLAAIILISCTGSLSDEQRKRIKESIEQGEIKKVSEAQITEAAFIIGRKVAAILEQDTSFVNKFLLDSLSQAYQIEIISLDTDNQKLRGVERLVLEAYQSGDGSDDNIQRMGLDSLLYTKAILHQNPDGSNEFLKAIGIRMTRKQVVLSIKD